MIAAILIFAIYVACILFVAKMMLVLGVLVLQVAIKCLPYAVGIWVVLMVLKGCTSG